MIGPLITLLRNETRRVWCYRWLVAVTSILLWAGATAYIKFLPNTYDAWGQIYVDQQTPLAAAAEGVSLAGRNYGGPSVVQTTLLNDENLEKIVRQIDPAVASEDVTGRARAVNRLRDKIRRAPDPSEGIIELHVIDTDPVLARDVVRLLMEQFVAANMGRSQRDLGRAGAFLDEQVASYGKMYADSQEKIAAFRREHPVVAAVALAGGGGVGFGGGYAELAPAEGAQAFAAPPPSRADERVAELEARLAALLTTYTEQYPDVVATRRQLADAIAAGGRTASQRQLALPPPSAPRRLVARGPASAPGPAPISPEIAAAWADLQKTDEVLRINYQQLLGKQAATRMSQAVYRDDEAGKYQIVREPTVPVIPIGPNRPLYFVLAGFLSIGAGVALGYVRAATKGILVSRQELEEIFQLPVIGTVSWEPAWHTPRQRPAHGWLGRRFADRRERARAARARPAETHRINPRTDR